MARYNDFILAGDFNIHVDTVSDESSKKLFDLLKNFSLRQHVKLPTHTGGHTLDLIISRVNTQLITDVSVVDFILEHELDILCITETWLQSDDSFTANHVTPSGYSIVSSPRLNRRGGGIAVIIKNDFLFKRLTCSSFSTFEVLLVQVISSSKSFVIATIYRPPGPNEVEYMSGNLMVFFKIKY